jgi:hypothetical protein
MLARVLPLAPRVAGTWGLGPLSGPESHRAGTKAPNTSKQICSLESWLYSPQLDDRYILFYNKRAFKKNTELLGES